MFNARHYSKLKLIETSNSFFDDLSVHLYDTQLSISYNLESAFSNPSLFGCGLLLTAGILSSLSPCSLSMIPLTSIYLGSNDNNVKETASTTSRRIITETSSSSSISSYRLIKSSLYASGLAFTFTLLGLLASISGQFFLTTNDNSTTNFSINDFSTFFTAIFTIFMGLNVLEIIPFSFNNNFDFSSQRKQLNIPWQIEPFVFGATAALVLSPCSSPVLASLLALVSNSHNPTLGGLYLFFYSLGYSLPTVLAVNSSLDFVKTLRASASSQYVNIFFGSILIVFGTYFALDSGAKYLFPV